MSDNYSDLHSLHRHDVTAANGEPNYDLLPISAVPAASSDDNYAEIESLPLSINVNPGMQYKVIKALCKALMS